MSPVATGGMTSGSETSVSTSTRPRKRRRASSHASASPGGIISAVAPTAVRSVKRVICQVSIGQSASGANLCRAKMAAAAG